MKKLYILLFVPMIMLMFSINTQAQLYINEFMASNDVSFPGPQGDYPDWIEIYNAGNEAVMLGGYYLSDKLDDPEAMFMIPDTYPDSVTVAAGGYILFYANKGEESSVLNLNFKLSGGGEAVGFWTPESAFIDSLTYGEQTSDISFGRYPDGTYSWGFMTDITPGTSNTNPTPAPVVLFINEFMASNDAAFSGPQGDYPDWIEIYNAGTEAVMLGGYYMSDKLDDPEAMFMIPDTYPDSVTVPAGGHILFYANKGEESSVLNLNFKLSGGGEAVGLWNPDQVVLDSLSYGEQFTDTSFGRYMDGTENWYLMTDISPGLPNTNPNPPAEVQLYINEFMASNDFALPGPQGDYPDWIEIYNAGSEAVMLGGYYMSDKLDDPEAMFMISDTYPDSVTVAAGGYILFYANKGHESSVLNLNFKLSGGGEVVGLWNADQTFIDSITYTEQYADTSFGRYEDGTENWYLMIDYSPGVSNRWVNAIHENISNITLKQNYPNPFVGTTNIEFILNEPEQVTITVYSGNGSVVSVLTDVRYSTGNHKITWDASQYPAGFYFYSIKTDSGTQVKKATVIK